MNLDRILSMDIEWVLYHLIHDDPDFRELSLDVDFYDDDVWERLLPSLVRNSSVTEVKIERHEEGEGARTDQELRDLFVALAGISSIQKLTLSAISHEDFAASIPLLQREHLQFCHFVWTGVEDGCVIPQSVGEALAAAPGLKELYGEDLSVSDCETWLGPICRSLSLEILRADTYSGLRLGAEGSVIFDHLAGNTVLQELSLGFLLDQETSSSIANMLRNNRSLKKVQLSFVSREEDCYLALLDALQHNRTLRILDNTTASAIGVDIVTQKIQVQLLQNNYHLQFLSLFRDEDLVLREKAMYLKLNKAGRKKLYHCSSDAGSAVHARDWLEVMAASSNSLDCLYYCLSQNPSLCKVDYENCNNEGLSSRKRKR